MSEIMINQEVPVVEWRTFNVRKEDGVAIICTKYLDKNLRRELYADGSIYTININDEIKKKEKVSINVLKKAVDDYKKKWKLIIIDDLLKMK